MKAGLIPYCFWQTYWPSPRCVGLFLALILFAYIPSTWHDEEKNARFVRNSRLLNRARKSIIWNSFDIYCVRFSSNCFVSLLNWRLHDFDFHWSRIIVPYQFISFWERRTPRVHFALQQRRFLRRRFTCPMSSFPILKPQNSWIDEFCVVQERRSPHFKPPKLGRGSTGYEPSTRSLPSLVWASQPERLLLAGLLFLSPRARRA